MEEFVGALLFGVFVVWLAVMAAWVALALLVRIVAWVIVYFAATAALGLVGGLLHGFTIPVQALMQGRAQVATPARMAAGELIKNPPPGENAAHGWDRAWPVYVPYQAGFDRQAVNALTKKRENPLGLVWFLDRSISLWPRRMTKMILLLITPLLIIKN